MLPSNTKQFLLVFQMASLLNLAVLFHLISICLGIIRIGWEEYIKHELRTTKKKLQLLENDGMLIMLQLISFHNLTVQIFGMLRAKRTFVSPFNSAMTFSSKCWLFLAIEALVFDILKLLLSLHLSQALILEAEGVLINGMKMYNIDIYWNIFWNQIQFSNSCCGVSFYKDWRNIKWRNLDQERIYTQLVKNNKTIVPSSCCQSQALCNIVAVKIQYDGSFVDISDFKTVNVFQNGCLSSFIQNATDRLEIGMAITFSSITIQLVTIIVHRIMFLKNREYL